MTDAAGEETCIRLFDNVCVLTYVTILREKLLDPVDERTNTSWLEVIIPISLLLEIKKSTDNVGFGELY